MTQAANPWGAQPPLPTRDNPPPSWAAMDKRTGEYITDEDGNYVPTDALLERWYRNRDALEVLKAKEQRLRDQVVGVFGDPAKEKGTTTVPLSNGFKLSIVTGINYKFDCKREGAKGAEHTEAVKVALQRIASEVENGVAIANALVRWKPELHEASYNAETLPLQARAILDTVLVSSPASPQVKIVPPKEK